MIGENLKKIRKSKKITLQQLENKTGITNSYISAIENGKKNNPSQDVLERLAAALEVPVSAFFDNIDIRKIEKNNDIRGSERDRDLERIERARSWILILFILFFDPNECGSQSVVRIL